MERDQGNRVKRILVYAIIAVFVVALTAAGWYIYSTFGRLAFMVFVAVGIGISYLITLLGGRD